MTLYVGDISPNVTSLGPGNRIALWLQGCTLNCPGCMSPELFTRRESCLRKVEEILRQNLAFAPGHRGLTISGGEPFQQAVGLRNLLLLLRRYTTLDVLLYSGYTLAELRKGPPEMAAVLSLTDFLISGPYRRDLPTTKPYRGSDNQVLHFLSPRAQLDGLTGNAIGEPAPSLEVRIKEDGSLHIIGIPRPGDRAKLRNLLLQRGIELKK